METNGLGAIEDHMSSNGQFPQGIETWKDMLENTKDASRSYKEAPLEQRKEKEDSQKALKRKIAEVEVLTCKADALAPKAEEENSFSLLST